MDRFKVPKVPDKMPRRELEVKLPLKGQWVRWVTREFGREGEIIDVSYPSMTVKWLGVEKPQVFPWAQIYFDAGTSQEMLIIPKPKSIPKADPSPSGSIVDVSTAAVILGSTPKKVRQKLRAGKLRGSLENGSWRVFL